MQIEIWESKEKKKVNVLVDPNGIGWVTKADFDYAFKKYKQMLKTSVMLLLEIGCFIVLYLLK